jgi:hypothetical protein
MDEKTILRFFRHVDISNDPDTCWLWNRKKSKRYGYIKISGKSITASRFSYEIFKGKIPDHLFVCHTCDTPRCVNPLHLFLGTASDNAQDSIKKNRNYFASKTYCKHGHPYSPENTKITTLGGRACKTCAAAYHGNHYDPKPKRTTCKHGHPLSLENVYFHKATRSKPHGWRACKICQARYMKKYNQKQRSSM